MNRAKQTRKQKTPKGYEIPVPKRSDVERDLKKLARASRKDRERS